MQHNTRMIRALMMSINIGVVMAFVLVTSGGCVAPKGGKNIGAGQSQELAVDGSRLEVREKSYDDGAIMRRTEGRVDAEGNFTRHGLLTLYWQNGQKKAEVMYVDGVPHGSRTTWYQSGQLWSQGGFVNGKQDGILTSWFPNGRIAQEIPLVNGAWHGTFREWHVNGQQKREVKYVDGLRQGTETIWDEEGVIAGQTEYVDGVAQP